MKKLLIIFVVIAGLLGACAQTEPPADTAGLMHKDDAPSDSGDANGGAAKAPPADTTESSSEGG